MNIILICLALRYKGDWDKIYKALEEKEKVTLKETVEVEKMLKESKLSVITILDNEYPQQLKAAYKPPFVIWVKGKLNTLNNKFITAAGNQKDSFSDKRIEEFLPEIEKSYVVINPYFKGIDKNIIENTKNEFLYIAPSGFDHIDIKENNNFMVISEYPPEVKPSVDKFRNRNRIIASFSEALVLFSSEKNGPINHLVTSFLNLGKEIYCFPGDGSEKDGNSELIKQGANLITSIKDISC